MGLLMSLVSLLLPLPLVILLPSVLLLVRRLLPPIPIISELLLLSPASAALPFVPLPVPLVMLLLSLCRLMRRRLFPNSTIPEPLPLLLVLPLASAPLPRCS